MISLKACIAVLRGRADSVKKRDAELRQKSRSYRVARWIVWFGFSLILFVVKLFAVMAWSAMFGCASNSGYGRGHAGYVTREEVEDRQGGNPAHFDYDLNQYTGPEVRR